MLKQSDLFKTIICLLLLSGLIADVAQARTIALPRTGQTKCFDNAGVEIDCAGTGQDGMFRSGVAWPDPRFTNNGDGTMTDNLTGLMWTRSGELSGWRTWQQALNYIKFMNEGSEENFGYTDWRLPNILEMESLSNRGASDFVQWLKDQGFINVYGTNGRNFYWTSTTNPGSSYRSSAYIYNILSDHSYAFEKTTPMYVWPVRGGQATEADPNYPANIPKTGQTVCYNEAGAEIDCAGTGQDGEQQWGVAWPEPRLTDNGDGTITDNLTGLKWQNAPSSESMTWSQALDYAAAFNPAGLNLAQDDVDDDWRLPDENQLGSLLSYGEPMTCGGTICLDLPVSSGWTGTTFPFPNMNDYAMTFVFWFWPYSPLNENDKTTTDGGQVMVVKEEANQSLAAKWFGELEWVIAYEDIASDAYANRQRDEGDQNLDIAIVELTELINDLTANIATSPITDTAAGMIMEFLNSALTDDHNAQTYAGKSDYDTAVGILVQADRLKDRALNLLKHYR